MCSSAPSLSELDSELEQLEQAQVTKFMTDETVSAVMDIANDTPQGGDENRTLGCSDGTNSEKISSDMDALLMPPPPPFPIGRPTAASLGLRESIEEHMKIKKPIEEEPEEEDNGSGELDLTGIDDEELDLVSQS